MLLLVVEKKNPHWLFGLSHRPQGPGWLLWVVVGWCEWESWGVRDEACSNRCCVFFFFLNSVCLRILFVYLDF